MVAALEEGVHLGLFRFTPIHHLHLTPPCPGVPAAVVLRVSRCSSRPPELGGSQQSCPGRGARSARKGKGPCPQGSVGTPFLPAELGAQSLASPPFPGKFAAFLENTLSLCFSCNPGVTCQSTPLGRPHSPRGPGEPALCPRTSRARRSGCDGKATRHGVLKRQETTSHCKSQTL